MNRSRKRYVRNDRYRMWVLLGPFDQNLNP